MTKVKIIFILLFYITLALSQDYQHPTTSNDQIIMGVGQIMPGKIDITQSKQQLHLLKLGQLQRKYLFIRASSLMPVRMSIGIYNNQTRQLIYACQDTTYDSCYVSTSSLKAETVYAILIVANDNMQYNLYAYWGDLEHIKPNQQVKFMFDKMNPSQLFHLQFSESTKYEQIRIILKPQASRTEGDYLRIFGNAGFKQQPTQERHDFVSSHVWGDAQAIFLSKQDLKGELGVALYVVGNAETVYVLQCEFINETNHALKVNEIIHQYLPKGQQTYYEMNFHDNGNVDSFVIKFSVFTGEVEVGFYYDREFKRMYQKLPYQYMSDMQFNINKNDFQKDTKEIFMKVRCPDTPSTYQITTQSRTKQQAFEITQNVYEFSALSEPKQAMYFFSHIWDQGQYEQARQYRFDVSIIKIFGSPVFQFYMCKPDVTEQQCKKINENDYFTKYVNKLKPVGIQQVGSKIIHTLELNESAFKRLNAVQKRLMIIVYVSNPKGDASAYAVQYSNANRVRLLREGRAFEDKVRLQQKKYYKYVNNNPNVTQIRIHVNEISGLTKIRAKRSKIFEAGNEIPMEKQVPDTIIIKDKVTDPIYLQVHGLVTSLYTISVSAFHTEHLVSNALVMAEDVEYEVKLLPYQHMNVQLHPIQSNIAFEFYSEGGSVMVCEVDYNDACLGDKLTGSHGQIKINAASKREIRIRIGNFIDPNMLSPNASLSQNLSTHLTQPIRKVKLTLIYHAQGLNHCDERRMNKVYSQNVKSGSCFKYHLPLASDVEIMTSRSDLGQTLQLYFVCSKKIVPAQINDRFVIKGDVIKQNCNELPNDMILQMFVGDSTDQKNKDIKMDYSVEYNNDTITLADGVAYVAKGYSIADAPLRTFFYEILDQDHDINIILYNKKGNQKFFAKIVAKPDRYGGFVSEGQSTISSKDSNYYINPHIQIKPQDIAKANCGRTCVLILSIYSSQKTGSEIQYTIQVIQNHVYLHENQIRKGFLGKGSVQFFEYQNRLGNGSLIFKVSDNNRKCARSIMSKNPFPTASNYHIKQNEGTIIYQKTQKGTVYFAVQAIQDCPYSVTVSQQNITITKIQHGQFYDIKLEQGQQKWFYHRHSSNRSFKVISLKKHGEINIYANQSDMGKNVLEDLQNNKLDRQTFAFKSFYKNTLVIKQDAKGFCFGCYYIICVRATKMTEGSIMIGSDQTKITMTENKILFDEIETKNGMTFASFYKISPGSLQVKVHSGKVNFEMSYGNEKFSKVFNKNKKVYHENYTFTKQQFTFKPIQIRITAQQAPALYSFELEPQANTAVLNHRVNPGEHSYIFLSKGDIECLTGTLTRREEEVFITVDTAQKLALSSLNLTVKLNEAQTTQYEKQLVGNIMSIKFKSQSQFFVQPQKYSICLKTSASNESISLLAFQNENVNLIHSDTQVLVRKQNKFVLYPGSDIILDLFECKGSAQIYYGSNLQTIRSKQSHKLDVIGIPGQSHAIKIESFSTLYVDVIAEMATLLWMPINVKQQRGVGYLKYAIGGLDYYPRFNMIDFKIGGIFKNKDTQTKPKLIKYTLYISNSKQLLQQAVMCQKISNKHLISASVTTDKVGNNFTHPIGISIDKKRITGQFSTNQTLYFNVVADMTLQPPNSADEEDHQHYRFIYFEQLVPSEVFRQNKVQSINLILLIVLAVVAVVGFILVSCIFVKYVVPAIGRLKNRVLVQQKDDPKDQSIPIPPSSDRNQIPTIPSGTEQQMNK